jgi:hypothetical protein
MQLKRKKKRRAAALLALGALLGFLGAAFAFSSAKGTQSARGEAQALRLSFEARPLASALNQPVSFTASISNRGIETLEDIAFFDAAFSGPASSRLAKTAARSIRRREGMALYSDTGSFLSFGFIPQNGKGAPLYIAYHIEDGRIAFDSDFALSPGSTVLIFYDVVLDNGIAKPGARFSSQAQAFCGGISSRRAAASIAVALPGQGEAPLALATLFLACLAAALALMAMRRSRKIRRRMRLKAPISRP